MARSLETYHERGAVWREYREAYVMLRVREGLTLTQIGVELGVDRERVRQVHAVGIRRFRLRMQLVASRLKRKYPLPEDRA